MAKRLDEERVRHVARLARLRIDDREVALFAEQLSSILDHVNQLNELNTEDVPPTAHPLPTANVFREDEPGEGWDAATALANAPARRNDFFEVPRVLDQESA